jgi:tetrathionate reductase subunit B
MLPACVDTCPTKARVFGDINDAESEAGILFRKANTIQVVNQQSNTNPNMYYIENTAPKDWPVQVSSPLPIRAWEKAGKPAVWAAVGVNAALVVGMLGQQFIGRKNKVAAQNAAKKEERHE